MPSSTKSRTDLHRLFSGEPGIPTDDSPELDWRYAANPVVRRGTPKPKTSIALRVDADVLAWFKSKGPGYQTRMNAVLRAFRDSEP
jgi:uncharacterized protein (DUF4415 family)